MEYIYSMKKNEAYGYTTISVKKDTYNALTELGTKKTSYDDIIQKLLPKKMRRSK